MDGRKAELWKGLGTSLFLKGSWVSSEVRYCKVLLVWSAIILRLMIVDENENNILQIAIVAPQVFMLTGQHHDVDIDIGIRIWSKRDPMSEEGFF